MSCLMLVDDDVTMSSLLKILLELEGHHVIIPSSVEEPVILQEISREKPGILFMDVLLKNGNGLDILRRIRQDPSMDQIKILITSGMDFREKAMQAGADGFLQKPYMPEDLINWIGSHAVK